MKRFLLCCGFSSLLVSISGCGQEDAGIIDGSRAVQIEGTAELCNDIINKKLPQNYLCQDWRNIGNPDMQKAVMTINGYTKILQSGKSIDNVSQADARKLVSDADESNSQDNSNKSQFSINNVIAGFLSPFTPKVQRQVTVLESVGTERCYSVSNLCYDWELGPQLNPYSLCLASPDLDAISKSDFTALLEKGSTIVGNPTELEKLKTRVTVNGQKDWKTNCNVRKYIMEGNAAIFESKSPQSMESDISMLKSKPPQSLDLADCNEMENMQMKCKGDDGKVYKSRISYCKSDPIQLGCEFILGST